MSTSSSASQPKWPKYGLILMQRCPDCPRIEPLKRFMCKTDKNGNLGHEFVKCLSKRQQGQIVREWGECTHLEWIDEYVNKLQTEGAVGAVAVTPAIDLGALHAQPVDLADRAGQRVVGRVVPASMMGNAELLGELKKINKQLTLMIDSTKQANIIAGGFYCCMIAMCFFYMFISR